MTAIAAALVIFVGAEAVVAPDPRLASNPAYAELLEVRSGLIDAYNRRDVEGILNLCHPQVVVTWQNAEVSETREGVRKYYEKMMTGPNRIVESMTADPTVDDLAVIHGGDTAVSRGKMNDHYRLTDGSEFAMNSRWSATLVKDGDRWLIASFHASVGAFDNPLLTMIVGKAALWTGLTAGLAGAVVGGAIAWFVARRRPAANPV
jgi:ketosteroid isomerase-like protein